VKLVAIGGDQQRPAGTADRQVGDAHRIRVINWNGRLISWKMTIVERVSGARPSLMIGATLSLCLILAGRLAGAASLAWTRDMTSAGLWAAGAPVAVAFGPRTSDPAVPRGATIAGVYASRQYDGAGVVATDLCWGSPAGPCVPVTGRSVDTHAFDGRSASVSLWLVHRVVHWGPDHPPLFVRGTVTVWYVSPARR
jgi:flagellar protein FlhE